jgi:glutaredoxin
MSFFDRFKNPASNSNSIPNPVADASVQPEQKPEVTLGDKVSDTLDPILSPITDTIDSWFDGDKPAANDEDANNNGVVDTNETGGNLMDDSITASGGHVIELYTLSYCGWCKKAKSVLDSYDIQYTEYQLDDANIIAGSQACQSDIYQTVEKMLADSGTTLGYEDALEIFTEIYSNPQMFDNAYPELSSSGNAGTSEMAAAITEYLSEHEEILPILEYFLEAEAKCEAEYIAVQAAHQYILDKFQQVISENGTGNFAPQIIIDGKYFGGYNEISTCPKVYGDVDSCFDAFTSTLDTARDSVAALTI